MKWTYVTEIPVSQEFFSKVFFYFQDEVMLAHHLYIHLLYDQLYTAYK